MSSQADGHAYRLARRAVLARDTTCHLCGHEGSDQVDHILPRSTHPEIPEEEITNLAPVHGVTRCPTCREACNQVKGNGLWTRPIRSRDW